MRLKHYREVQPLQIRIKTMPSQNFIQLELPFMQGTANPLQQTEQAIQNLLDLAWKSVLANISVRTTKELMRQHGKLVALNDGQAWIKVSSLPVLRLAKEKIPAVESAFRKAFGVTVKVYLEV
ncbi:MAG TPA: hypothetical protein DDW76_24975 [Cyanobacteria bacterium UBA11369]|nr:hypothetical protein [Cyanobacteria bacterium UBA8543]HAZ48986.1 hypothetical protein [Cyanobacteria bacterium UBA11371]HBE19789.1 hypothetical protein [Cyanobacteria bacterium UBA11367]HBE32768.1 hypothetical protein [Cyanobacteria bacterium UBA11368]HBE51939.1 hypothetical protein [Cyanobacteria bacterium UBA11369]HBW87402.1 hypothetical protein [Cyanobacteria bacterium UBA11149]